MQGEEEACHIAGTTLLMYHVLSFSTSKPQCDKTTGSQRDHGSSERPERPRKTERAKRGAADQAAAAALRQQSD